MGETKFFHKPQRGIIKDPASLVSNSRDWQIPTFSPGLWDNYFYCLLVVKSLARHIVDEGVRQVQHRL